MKLFSKCNVNYLTLSLSVPNFNLVNNCVSINANNDGHGWYMAIYVLILKAYHFDAPTPILSTTT